MRTKKCGVPGWPGPILNYIDEHYNRGASPDNERDQQAANDGAKAWPKKILRRAVPRDGLVMAFKKLVFAIVLLSALVIFAESRNGRLNKFKKK